MFEAFDMCFTCLCGCLQCFQDVNYVTIKSEEKPLEVPINTNVL